MKFLNRKNIRLKEYDYSRNGAYFITICTNKRKNLFWNENMMDNVSTVGANCVRPQNVPLSNLGKIVDNEINILSNIYQNIKIINYVIMPNHIHMIIFNYPNESGQTQFTPTISRIIKQFKGSISKKTGKSIWQRSFHDHIIRNEKDYQNIYSYINSNPFNWADDCFYSQ